MESYIKSGCVIKTYFLLPKDGKLQQIRICINQNQGKHRSSWTRPDLQGLGGKERKESQINSWGKGREEASASMATCSHRRSWDCRPARQLGLASSHPTPAPPTTSALERSARKRSSAASPRSARKGSSAATFPVNAPSNTCWFLTKICELAAGCAFDSFD